MSGVGAKTIVTTSNSFEHVHMCILIKMCIFSVSNCTQLYIKPLGDDYSNLHKEMAVYNPCHFYTYVSVLPSIYIDTMSTIELSV